MKKRILIGLTALMLIVGGASTKHSPAICWPNDYPPDDTGCHTTAT